MLDLSQFTFDGGELALDPVKDFVARVPPGLTTKKDLFNVLEGALRLPAYFGKNWDALDECLGDLSWIHNRRVVLIHDDVPALDSNELQSYLCVLLRNVSDWKNAESHELVVVFPHEYRPQLERMTGWS